MNIGSIMLLVQLDSSTVLLPDALHLFHVMYPQYEVDGVVAFTCVWAGFHILSIYRRGRNRHYLMWHPGAQDRAFLNR